MDCAGVATVRPHGHPNQTAGVNIVYLNPLSRSRMTRIAWSILRHPVKCREFPAKHERLITASELMRYGY